MITPEKGALVTVSVVGHSVHKPAVHTADLEGGVGDALALAALGYFNQLQTADRGIIEFQGLGVSHLDLDGLGGCVEDIAVQRADLLGNDSHAGFQALNHDPAIFVRHILAIVGSQKLSIGLRNQKGNALQRGGGAGNIFFDDKAGRGVIFKSEVITAIGPAANVRAAARSDIGSPAYGPGAAAVHAVGAVF